ncbi:similar to Saccharomyces cerevisiae YNL326C PFA3 Palmitoyltransferase for Vac8p, required for vacuolar membrane fusion [Maudiozyma saulgeensis]|uniref:Palmitoyltransferase n=1 Tax=Maudiozyma saulgeensis TaxID=1789683 RepID=A0A1X7R222_9SACH|nr:similar to Saccharomyces cerevisiae YNL326C PFA3 Palmitoyltransferase for Vac8p, required for vacuolar membrane fusion [Kazachstania saulgeensis]
MSIPNLSVASLFPKVLTTGLYIWTYYVTVTRVTVLPYNFMFSVVTTLATLALYTYFKVINVGPGSPLDFQDLSIRDLHNVELGTELPPEYLTQKSVTIKHDGRFRVCQTCKHWKPDRCHHCSSCERCILKMDHHCPWFAECIGFSNQKFFIQFLLYTTFYSTFILIITSTQLYRWFHSGKYAEEYINIRVLQIWLLSIAVTTSMFVFSWFTINQLLKNQTTIEMYGQRRYRREFEIRHGMLPASDINMFDLGSSSANWKEVMGNSFIEWILPIKPFKSQRSRHTLDEHGLYFNVHNSPATQALLDDSYLQDRLTRRVTPRSSLDIYDNQS